MVVAVYSSGLGAGLILGWVQQMRGAHFLFHTLCYLVSQSCNFAYADGFCHQAF
jgi:membrane-associated PAP2 superfamily phosphatase